MLVFAGVFHAISTSNTSIYYPMASNVTRPNLQALQRCCPGPDITKWSFAGFNDIQWFYGSGFSRWYTLSPTIMEVENYPNFKMIVEGKVLDSSEKFSKPQATLPKFNSSSLKSFRNPIGKHASSFPTIFQGPAVKLRGCNRVTHLKPSEKNMKQTLST